MTNYADLDLDCKKELLVNLKALYLLASSLSKVTGCNLEAVTNEMWKKAYSSVISLSDEEVDRFVAEIESDRKPFEQPGSILVG